MKLLELLPQVEIYGRIRKQDWENRYLVRTLDVDEALVYCDLECMVIQKYMFSFYDLLCDDWEMVR
jgi:hypothetical protein